MRFRNTSFGGELETAPLSANREWSLPDRSGEIITAYGPSPTYNPIASVTASKLIGLTDVGTVQDCINAAAATLTIQPDGTLNLPIGVSFTVTKRNGPLSIVAGAGVTLLKRGAPIASPAPITYRATVRKVAANSWLVLDDEGLFTTISQSNPIEAAVYRSAALTQAITAGSPVALVPFDTVANQNPATLYNPATSRFTVTANELGLYHGNFSLELTSSVVATVSIQMRVNGVIQRTIAKSPVLTANTPVYLKGSFKARLLNPVDFLEFFLFSNVANNLTYLPGQSSCFCDLTKVT